MKYDILYFTIGTNAVKIGLLGRLVFLYFNCGNSVLIRFLASFSIKHILLNISFSANEKRNENSSPGNIFICIPAVWHILPNMPFCLAFLDICFVVCLLFALLLSLLANN